MTSNTLLQRINQQQFLRNLRNKLLTLHSCLLQIERIAYEQVRGRVTSNELLRLVISDEQFAWLHRISEMVVQIDEMLAADEPLALEDIQNLITQARNLIVPSEEGSTFAKKYYAALQSEPSVVMAHSDLLQLLASK
ncbi:hypothetical protein NIES37_51000 [Tolypothrix tenuis PCC 7101]|uniref:Uncharacterized protein n=1 Tax=Tolypothrix tenuis PCC 7101 TaxID=231146 RepID=A0A1Z4N613_9CYAN|nr:hypothetical protein [Aulosira sp. FACHB-113]BAZ01102.1 hypothetical protein NIES37_51000 [Tolypothrix tenuis PCC 7101]BAZ74976.1 hypothetical protein NIES50_35560 [Aulosira laxa NIES-50]